MVGFIMASYGTSTTISAMITSRLAKYSGRHVLFGIAIIIQMCIFVAMYVYKPVGIDDIPYLFAMAIIWGIAEGIWQTQSNGNICYKYCALRIYHGFGLKEKQSEKNLGPINALMSK